MNEVISMYNSGMYQREIAEKFGVSQGMISIRLRKAGIKLRSRGESDKIVWSRKTPSQRYATYEAAHAAARNRKHSHTEKCQRAIFNQNNPKLSELEQKFLYAFQSENIPVISQFALDIYNIDFALPNRKIAIEIDGGNWHNSSKKRKYDTGKEVLLRRRKWALIRFQVCNRLKIVADIPTYDFVDVINAVCSNPSLLS